MTDQPAPTPDELREQAETDMAGVHGGELQRLTDGPTVAECADNDRRWDLQREGE